MAKLLNLAGQTFGFLTVTGPAPANARGSACWLVKCQCGTEKTVRNDNLTTGNATSCGCRQRNKKHEQSSTRTYHIWQGMKKRCSPRAKDHDQKNYFLRGIRVCKRWENFPEFLADMGHASESLTLEREDNNKGYEPGNCRWATQTEQLRNTRKNVLVNFNGKTMLLADAVRETGMSQYRLRRYHSVNPPSSYFNL